MSPVVDSDPSPNPPRPSRWQAALENAGEPLFLLDRRRRVAFVNRAFEALAGLPAEQVRGLACRQPRPPAPPAAAEDALAHALTPPPEALEGRTCRARRLLGGPARRWWDVEFFPIRQAGRGREGLVILGRVAPAAVEEPAGAAPLPERIVALRERAAQRCTFDLLASGLPAMRRLAAQVRLASRLATPVLLVGEPGTGKQTIARVIHYQGPGREQPFAALDCTRLPAWAVAGLLLGSRKGDPPQALGTVYLREPAALPRDVQLRLAERLADEADDKVTRWQGDKGTEDVAPAPGTLSPGHPVTLSACRAGPRILAGSRATLAESVASGRMLEELACALGTLVLEVPPLRERGDDLPALVERLLAGAGAEDDTVTRWQGDKVTEDSRESVTLSPCHLVTLSPGAWEIVRAAPWPGNLRQLAAVLAGAAARAEGGRIDVPHLPAPLRLAVCTEQAPAPPPPRPLPLAELLEQAERRLIELALRRAHGNKTRAAELLAVWRPRLQRRMDALHITGGPDVAEE